MMSERRADRFRSDRPFSGQISCISFRARRSRQGDRAQHPL